MGKRRNLDLEELKKRVVAESKRILKYEGRDALNARNLAEKVGFSVGTLYNTFNGMDDLILHINADTLSGLEKFVLEATENVRSTRQLGRVVGSSYLEYGRRNPHLWNLLFEHQIGKKKEFPYWYQQRVKGIFGIVESLLERMLDHLDKKRIRRAARTLWAGLHGICFLEINGKLTTTGAESPLLLWDTMLSNFIRGVKAGRRKATQE